MRWQYTYGGLESPPLLMFALIATPPTLRRPWSIGFTIVQRLKKCGSMFNQFFTIFKEFNPSWVPMWDSYPTNVSFVILSLIDLYTFAPFGPLGVKMYIQIKKSLAIKKFAKDTLSDILQGKWTQEYTTIRWMRTNFVMLPVMLCHI